MNWIEALERVYKSDFCLISDIITNNRRDRFLASFGNLHQVLVLVSVRGVSVGGGREVEVELNSKI